MKPRVVLLTSFALLAVLAAPSLLSAQNRNKKPPVRKPPPKRLPTADEAAAARLKVAKVDPQLADQIKASAAKIDELVEANYKQFDLMPNPRTTDEQFMRRVYLDITGTIPSYQQAETFLDSRAADKREKLIDQLLNSPGYASHFYNYWGDILRLTDRPEPNIIGEPYNEWVKQALRDNMPYDKMVRELLTAEGKIWENPAVGYTLRDSGMPLDAMNNTVRVFLGTQIGCAQCHDHPFDKWKQREFYEIAAYTFGTKTRLGRSSPAWKNGNPQVRLRAEFEKMNTDNKMLGSFNRLVRANTYEVYEIPGSRLKFPHDYAYQDAKPGELVSASVIFGNETPIARGQSPRKQFASWLASKENPRFAGVIANRLWKRAMGVGLIDPVDDIQDSSRPENMALMGFLITEMKRLDFNLKEFQRIIYNSKTYQRQASTAEVVDGETYHFPGPTLRRMTAEQVWDSLLTMAIYNPDAFLRPSVKNIASTVDLDLASVTAQEVLAKAEEYDEKYGRKKVAELRKKYGYKGQVLARASELPLPVPPNHFLRQFGQGDRELISGASTDGSVPQVLTMFNGPVTHMMLERGSVIYDNVMKAKTQNEQINVIFLSVLSRKPTTGDRSVALREMQSGAAGYGNVIWALLNTREFLFIQ